MKEIKEIEVRAEILEEQFYDTLQQLIENFEQYDTLRMKTIFLENKDRIRIESKNWWEVTITFTRKRKENEDSSVAIEENTSLTLEELKTIINENPNAKYLTSERHEFNHDWLKYVLTKHTPFGCTLEVEKEVPVETSKEEEDRITKYVEWKLKKLWHTILSPEGYWKMRDLFHKTWTQAITIDTSSLESLLDINQ